MHHQISIKPLRQHLRAAILAVSIGSVPAIPAFAAEPNAALHEYHIPAGPLSQVLSRFAAEAGILLSADASLADGKASPGLNGQYSIENGFEILLKDSGLVVHRHGQKRYSITAKPEQGNALPEVEVKTRTDSLAFSEEYSGGQVARVGNIGLLGNKDFMETPFSTISYTEEAIANRQSGNVMNIISQTDPSVNIIGSAENSGYYLRTSLRGFSTTSASYGFNGLYGLGSYQSSFTSAFAERVEVLKGPSALLNGMLTDGSVGGAINIVTKRAADAPLTRLTAGYESDSIWKTHLDVGRRFGENNEWGVRFNAIKEQGDATTKYKERNNDAYALALDYRGDRLRLSADIFQYKTHITGDNGSITLANTTTKVPSAPQHGRLIGGEPWASMDDKNTGGMFKAEFDLTKKTSAWISAGYNRSNPDQIGVAGWMNIDPTGNYTITRAVRFNFKYKSQAADAGLRHAFQTGSIKHEIVLNANTSTRKRYDPAGGWRQYISLSGTGNIYDPSYTARPQNIPSADGYVKAEENKLQSFGIADTLHFLDDSVLLTLGLRRQSVEQVFSDYHKTVTTPAVGLLFKVNERVSLYGNYIEGLSAGSTAPTTAANAGEVFEPYQTKQVEAGVKLDLNGFATTIAAFQIKQPSAYTDPTTNIYSVDGEQRNQGLELNFFGEQQRNLRVLGGVTWMQGKLMKTSGGVNEGKTAVEVPKLVAKLGVEYDITSVPGLTLTANAIHTGKQYINQANTLSVPSWRRYDLGARYVTRIGDKPVTLRASVFNITDKVYWMGQLYRGVSDPRTVQLSATIDF